jgi:eukaryotic-like serine/threonine-protein kinase
MDGRYSILGSLAKGGMATVYLGRVTGSAGFSRLVAIKRLHPELAAEKEFVGMLVDEARLASQIRHTNVVDTLDLVVSDGAFSLVLEYVEGNSLSRLLKRASELEERVPRRIALTILYGVLRGLDAAHEARNEDGQPLGIVHRDVSPQNILLGVDGIPRVIDFGVAKAIGRFESTRPGEIRGKFSYMAPEQMQARPVTRQVDVYAAGVVLWELLAGRKLFDAEDSRAICAAVMRGDIKKPSTENADVEPELDAMVMRATAREIGDRYLTARELLTDLEKLERASDDEVGLWVRQLCAKELASRQRLIQNAAPIADGRPLEELIADLAKSAPSAPGPSAPGLSAEPPVARESETNLASTAGIGLEIPAASSGVAKTAAAPARRRTVFKVALVVVGFLAVVGLFLRFRPAPDAPSDARSGSGENGGASATPSVEATLDAPPTSVSGTDALPVPTASTPPSGSAPSVPSAVPAMARSAATKTIKPATRKPPPPARAPVPPAPTPAPPPTDPGDRR